MAPIYLTTARFIEPAQACFMAAVVVMQCSHPVYKCRLGVGRAEKNLLSKGLSKNLLGLCNGKKQSCLGPRGLQMTKVGGCFPETLLSTTPMTTGYS